MYSSRFLTGAKPVLATTLALALHAASSHSSDAALIITYAENPGEMETTLSGTSVFTFNSLVTNTKHTNVEWTGVGTIDQVFVSPANVYGGATDTGLLNGTPTRYAVQSATVGGANATAVTILDFSTEQAYFGLWWSAGDASNQLQFYRDGELVADYSTATLLNAVAADTGYKGNPTVAYNGQNMNEAYAFVNFYGMDGTTWDRIVFTNSATSGFESDNWTTRTLAYGELPDEDPENLPGKKVAEVEGTTVTTIPEPSGTLFAGVAGMTLILLRRRK